MMKKHLLILSALTAFAAGNIQAANAENLRLGASNWVNTMDIAWEK